MENRTYIEKNINEITKEDFNVAVTGIIINKNKDSFILDDKTGQIQIILEDSKFDVNTFIRVFARVVPLEEGIQLHAVAAQDLTKIDKFLYNKIKSLLHD